MSPEMWDLLGAYVLGLGTGIVLQVLSIVCTGEPFLIFWDEQENEDV